MKQERVEMPMTAGRTWRWVALYQEIFKQLLDIFKCSTMVCIEHSDDLKKKMCPFQYPRFFFHGILIARMPSVDQEIAHISY